MANQWISDALPRVHFEFKFQTSYAMIITAYTGHDSRRENAPNNRTIPKN